MNCTHLRLRLGDFHLLFTAGKVLCRKSFTTMSQVDFPGDGFAKKKKKLSLGKFFQ